MSDAPIENLEKDIGHSFQNKSYIEDALTHSSSGRAKNYERLEFLGDRVLGLVIAQMLFERFPDEPEGDLAKRLAALVQGRFLAQIARKIDLGSYVMFSDAEKAAGGSENENILADVFEAVIGALYLDSGFDKCQSMIERLWADGFYEMKAPPQHPKTTLQEWAQAQGLPLPVYKIVGQSGPDHMPVFDVELLIEGYAPLVSQGPSRQEAERSVALAFLQTIDGQNA
ncbi:MAG: ribonuclease III [Alphaproteobacteria bacterium]|nr:ribonuclease III [Alphaproteobacteria bacterium]